jgi:hypothetical protein
MSEDAWNDAADDLKAVVLHWVTKDLASAKRYLSELSKEDIISFDNLETRAQSSRWISTLDSFSNGLAAGLEKWKLNTNVSREPTESTLDLPLKADLQLNPQFKSSYDSYSRTADMLCDENAVRMLAEDLMKLRDWDQLHPPFVFLESSSGRGKTQMAFSLKAFFKKYHPDIKVLYLLCQPTKSNSQAIYRTFESVTNAFLQCAEADLQKACQESNYMDKLQGIFLRNSALSLFGFFEYMFQELKGEFPFQKISNRNVIERKRGGDLVDRLKESFVPPVVILDEFLPWNLRETASQEAKDRLKARMILLRGVFRCLGCAVMVMGTNSKAANLKHSSSISRSSGEVPTWCLIRSNFPKPIFFNLGSPSDLQFCNLLQHSRPLFGHTLLKFSEGKDVSSAQCLEDCLVEVAKIVSMSKRSDNETGFLRGQMALFMSVYNSINYSTLVHYHFADLLEKFRSADLDEHFKFKSKDGEVLKWASDASFPAMDEDILLYLCLMGLPGAPPFLLGDSEVSFACAWERFQLSDLRREFELNPANSSQQTNDGMFLENMLSVSAIAASHSCGLRGAPLPSFITNFVYHLISENFDKNQLVLDFSIWNGVRLFDEFVVPMLSPPGKEWPDFLRRDTFNVGNLWRSKNEEKVDFSSNCSISGEAKHHAASICHSVMINILRRVPKHSALHLVLVGKLQSTYFSDRSKKQKQSETDDGERFSFEKTFRNKFDSWGLYFLSENKIEELPIDAYDYQSPRKDLVKHIALFVPFNQVKNLISRQRESSIQPQFVDD